METIEFYSHMIGVACDAFSTPWKNKSVSSPEFKIVIDPKGGSLMFDVEGKGSFVAMRVNVPVLENDVNAQVSIMKAILSNLVAAGAGSFYETNVRLAREGLLHTGIDDCVHMMPLYPGEDVGFVVDQQEIELKTENNVGSRNDKSPASDN